MNSWAFCLPPCERGFKTHNGLTKHRQNQPECHRRWEAHLAEQVNGYVPQNAIQDYAGNDHGFNLLGHNHNVTAEPNDGTLSLGNDSNPVDHMEIWEEVPGSYEEDEDMLIVEQSVTPPFGDNTTQAGEENEQDWVDENVDDYDNFNPSSNGDTNLYEELYEGAAQIQTHGAAPFYVMLEEQQRIGQNNHYYPFAGEKEWELACWLHSSGLSWSHIDSFIKLKFVSPHSLSPGTL
jgi:hypothetical protein